MKQTLKKILAVLIAAGLAGAVSAPAMAKGHGGHGGGGHRGGGGFHGGGGRHHRPPPPRHHGGHRWHGSYGVFMSTGPGFWSPWYDPYPTYHTSTVIVQQPPQPVYYANKHDGDQQPQYWYYCNNPQGYYPYISQCSSRWVKVRPFPVDAQQ